MKDLQLGLIGACLAAALAVPMSAPSQDLGDPDLAPDSWGTEVTVEYISAEEFQPDDDMWSYYRCGRGYYCTSIEAVVAAAVNLPSGALITGVRLFYNGQGGGVELLLGAYWHSGGNDGYSSLAFWEGYGSPGKTSVYVDVSPDETVVHRWKVGLETFYQSYMLSVYIHSGAALRGAAIYWNRQISPAPGSATFLDVPTNHWAFQHVEALAASGITAGCGGGNYCPDSSLTRAQMAVFLAKALGLHYPY